MTQLTPDVTTRAGRMLAAGRLTMTVKSVATGKHLTVDLSCCVRDERTGSWDNVPFSEAKWCFLQLHTGERIGTYYPQTGDLRPKPYAQKAWIWAAMATIRAACGDPHPQAEFSEMDRCGRCARPLTDPVSIQRGIGPDCWGALTGSKHASTDYVLDTEQARRMLEHDTAARSAAA